MYYLTTYNESPSHDSNIKPPNHHVAIDITIVPTDASSKKTRYTAKKALPPKECQRRVVKERVEPEARPAKNARPLKSNV